jgi:hypothetical protein
MFAEANPGALRPGPHGCGGPLFHFNRLFELEAESGLGGQDNVLVAGESSTAGARATVLQGADGCALAAVPLPAAVRTTEEVEMDCSAPPTVTESSATAAKLHP